MEHASTPAAALEAAPPASPPPPPQGPSPPHRINQLKDQHKHEVNEVDTTADLIAGWLGGAVGVLVGNPFEVLKVRLQTSTSSSHHHHPSPSAPRVGKSSVPPLPSPAFPFPPPPTPLGQTPVPAVATASPSTKTVVPPPIPPSGVSPSSSASPSPSALPSKGTDKPPPPRVGLLSLYRTEGFRFFFAGTAGPILGLAFIDSAFFGLYGRVMQTLGQDRQDPNSLVRVFLSGATAGGMCALLETPIEVVKTRAQVESVPGKKLGSFRIAREIARKEGLRGFYIGGLMTAVHDGVSSGIFFSTYFVLRRLLRGEHPFHSAPSPHSSSLSPGTSQSPLEQLASPLPSSAPQQPASVSPLCSSPSSSCSSASSASASALATPSPSPSPDSASRPALLDSDAALSASDTDEQKKGGMGKGEVARILLAGGLAGALSAVVPYPFDIVKTRLQTANFESRARSSPVSTGASSFTSNATPFHTPSSASGPAAPPPPAAGGAKAKEGKMTVRSVFRGIHADGVVAWRYRYTSTWLYSFLSRSVFPLPSSSSPSPSSSSPPTPAALARGGERVKVNPRAEKWALRILGLGGFGRGLGPTVVSSFVGSAATITTVELALHFMGVNGGGGGGIG
ncbi:hypothetical protein JCM8097_003027 [Rhodosporidiobolus ruineniae]